MPRAFLSPIVGFLLLHCAGPGPTELTETTSSTGGGSTADQPTEASGPDLGAPEACGTILQNCPMGQKCTGVKPSLLDPYQNTTCVDDNAGIGNAAGSICFTDTDGWDSCDPDSMCMQFGSGEGACVPFCAGSPDAPTCDDPAQVCARVDHLLPISLCVLTCDPLEYNCPDVDLGSVAMVCQPATVGFGCVLRGNLSGKALGEPCRDHRDCTAAARCAPPQDVPGCPGADGCCAAYCDLNAPTCPLPAQGCVAYYAPGEAVPGLEDVGLCAVP